MYKLQYTHTSINSANLMVNPAKLWSGHYCIRGGQDRWEDSLVSILSLHLIAT